MDKYKLILGLITCLGIVLFLFLAFIFNVAIDQLPIEYTLFERAGFVFFASGGLVLLLNAFFTKLAWSAKSFISALFLTALMIVLHIMLVGSYGHNEDQAQGLLIAFIIEFTLVLSVTVIYFLFKKKQKAKSKSVERW